MEVSGRAMIEALRAGKADPATISALTKRRMQSKLPFLEQALTGIIRDHPRRLLAMQLAHIDFLDDQIAALSDTVQTCLAR
jgi:transposase